MIGKRDGPPAVAGDDGSVVVRKPDERSKFDMGNKRLFATFDGGGSLDRCVDCHGYDALTWKTRVWVQSGAFSFEEASGIGRTWELKGSACDIHVALTSFLDEDNPAVFQRMVIRNNGPVPAAVRISLRFSAHPRLPITARIKNAYARFISRFPGTALWWAVSGAKISLPIFAKALMKTESGVMKTKGKNVFTWRSDRLYEKNSSGRSVEFIVEAAPGQKVEIKWVMCAGGETEAAGSLRNMPSAYDSACSYTNWLVSHFHGSDIFLKSLFVAGLNTAVSMFKEFPFGFRGFIAGPDYAYPPRLYFRDGFWTAQILLKYRPDLVRQHLLSLARGVHPDGQCPSGVFAPHLFRADSPSSIDTLDWLPDHFDSPSYFILLTEEYVAVSGDASFLDEEVNSGSPGASIWGLVQKAADYLSAKDTDNDGLIEKPYAANDWADNVRRNVWVTYDQALYAAALFSVERLAKLRKENRIAESYGKRAGRARDALNEKLWDEDRGLFIDYSRPGYTENHFALDTLVALRYGLVDEDKIDRLLLSAKKTQTRHNQEQAFGDWGVMCAFPLYARSGDLFSKSALPQCYHNGADWPYLDGIYAKVLKDRGDADWYYVATRWWEYGLSRGWLTPVEYFSPPYEPGGMLQGWSSTPAIVCAEKK